MFSRINSAKPKYFGTLDLTHGYWQVGLTQESMKYTAFICCLGLYMFTRVAMGLRNASGHFQQRLVYEVLMGLIWLICELYIDDLIVHAKTKEEFLVNLRKIFERFSSKGLLMNPAKCYLGMETAEFVGKQIDNEGISFSAKKLSGVELFPLPKSANDIKKFIGLVNYFRDHIPHTTEIIAPLLALIPDYDKRKHRRLQWRELDDKKVERTTGDILEHMRPAYEAFERAKNAIIECPKLYFFQYDRDTILCTDASDIGAGGYLYQVDKEGREYPIAFASKSFSKQQRRWATPDKEAFAIYYCVKKFSHYLRDIHFTIRTDHKNLLYIDKDPDAKIRRYKLALQEYDCDWEYINTHDNIVADDMSRLCPSVHNEISEQFPIEEREWLNAIIQEFEIPQKVYNFLGQIHNSQVGHLGVEKTIHRVEKIFADYDAYYTEDIDGDSHQQTSIRMMQDIESTIQSHPTNERYRTIRSDIKRREKKFTQALEELRADEEINLDSASIRRYVKKFIRQCPCCQKMSQIKIPIHTIPFTTASYYPMERLNIDTIGPLKEDEDGNTYLIAIIDCFSRWVGLYPVKDVTANEAVKALLDHFAVFGCPTQLLSDNGSQFINQLIDEFMKLISTEHITTLAYSKEENAMVERVNKESMRHIRNLIFEYKDTNKWRNFSKMVMRILNATVHESIGVSPSQILFGNAIELDRGLLMPLETPNDDLSTALSEWSAAMLQMQSKLIKDAQDTQRKRDEHNIARRTHEELTEFAIDSYVLVGYPKSAHNPGPPTKFHARLKGPMQVVNKVGNTYTLRNLVNNQTKDYHITALRQFIYDPAYVDPRVVAMSDDQYFEVERIKAHRGTFNHKKQLRFHVKWVGYPDDEENNTWLLWKDLRNNIALHNYLRNNNLQKHIPQPFQ
jgi:transposase InsO family protein